METIVSGGVAEELRETIIAMGRELDLLRTEARHANLLIAALDSVLAVDRGEDPFAGVFTAVSSIFEYSHALALVEKDGDHGVLECVSSSHNDLVGSSWKVDQHLGKVLSGRVLTTISAADSGGWPAEAAGIITSSQPALYLPLRVRERRGLLMLMRTMDRGGFDRGHVSLARKFSLLASHAFAASRANQTEAESHRLKRLTERLEASQEELTYRANHDQLTGLANRSHIEEKVNDRIDALLPGEKLALAFFDVDHFKQVNDFYGHGVGDALLKGVAERLRGEVRGSDLIGRISGDEFVMAFAPIHEQSEIVSLIERVRARLAQPFEIDGTTLQASATIGVSIHPDHGPDYETLRRNADMAMYQAKSTNKGGVGHFDEALGKVASEKMQLERRLRAAIDNRQFTYALQPKVDIQKARIIGFEALARWIDDNGVVQPPARFLQAAHELGLLDAITHTIIETLAEDLSRLDASFGADVRYSLNITAQQAGKPNFMSDLVRRIDLLGCSRRIVLELTEETFVSAGLFQSRVLPQLREAGIGVSIDDFGTGFSCLSILADITADELKVDRSLITSIHLRPRSQSILRAIVSLSGALGMDVVAEGIETEEERAYLLDSTSIRFGQGYLFSRPRFVDDLVAAGPLTIAVTPRAIPRAFTPGPPGKVDFAI